MTFVFSYTNMPTRGKQGSFCLSARSPSLIGRGVATLCPMEQNSQFHDARPASVDPILEFLVESDVRFAHFREGNGCIYVGSVVVLSGFVTDTRVIVVVAVAAATAFLFPSFALTSRSVGVCARARSRTHTLRKT